MGVLSDSLKATLDQMAELDARSLAATNEFISKARQHIDDLQAALEDEGDPKAAAIQLLREEGWTLIPPPTRR